jgi:hypothetical protein
MEVPKNFPTKPASMARLATRSISPNKSRDVAFFPPSCSPLPRTKFRDTQKIEATLENETSTACRLVGSKIRPSAFQAMTRRVPGLLHPAISRGLPHASVPPGDPQLERRVGAAGSDSRSNWGVALLLPRNDASTENQAHRPPKLMVRGWRRLRCRSLPPRGLR